MNTLLLLASSLAFLGCAVAATSQPATRPATRPARDGRFTIALDGPTIRWTARVNSGGWRLTTDRAVRDGDTLRVFATLERPGEHEMVTAAFTTLRGERPGDGAMRAELSVRETRRGEATDAPFKVVARSDD